MRHTLAPLGRKNIFNTHGGLVPSFSDWAPHQPPRQKLSFSIYTGGGGESRHRECGSHTCESQRAGRETEFIPALNLYYTKFLCPSLRLFRDLWERSPENTLSSGKRTWWADHSWSMVHYACLLRVCHLAEPAPLYHIAPLNPSALRQTWGRLMSSLTLQSRVLDRVSAPQRDVDAHSLLGCMCCGLGAYSLGGRIQSPQLSVPLIH